MGETAVDEANRRPSFARPHAVATAGRTIAVGHTSGPVHIMRTGPVGVVAPRLSNGSDGYGAELIAHSAQFTRLT